MANSDSLTHCELAFELRVGAGLFKEGKTSSILHKAHQKWFESIEFQHFSACVNQKDSEAYWRSLQVKLNS